MRCIEIMKKISLHACVICSIILLTAHVMDSYNPYMDFMGHSSWAVYVMCVCSLFSGIVMIFGIGAEKEGGKPGGAIKGRQ